MMEHLLTLSGYNRDFLFRSYAKYSNDKKEDIYTFKTEEEEVSVLWKQKEILNEIELVNYLHLTAQKYNQAQHMQDSFSYDKTTSLLELYMNLYNLSPTKDKEIFADKKNNPCVFLFKENRIKGYAVLKNGKTLFNTADKTSCWSTEQSKIIPRQNILFTTSLEKVINRRDENIILGNLEYSFFSNLFYKFNYENIYFDSMLNWFIGNIQYLNKMTNNLIMPYIESGTISLYSYNKIDCLREYLITEKGKEIKYQIQYNDSKFKEIIYELHNEINIIPFSE